MDGLTLLSLAAHRLSRTVAAKSAVEPFFNGERCLLRPLREVGARLETAAPRAGAI